MEQVQLNIKSKDEVEELISFYQLRKTKLMQQYESVFNQLKEYDQKISALQAAVIGDTKPSLINEVNTFYNKKGTWNDKIKFFLDSRDNRAMTSKEIKTFITQMEQPDEEGEKRIGIGVSATLSMGVKSGIYELLEKDGKNVYRIKK